MKSLGSRHQPHGLFFSLSRLLIRCSHVKITHDYVHVWHFYSSLSLSCFPLSHSTSVSHVRGSVQVSQLLYWLRNYETVRWTSWYPDVHTVNAFIWVSLSKQLPNDRCREWWWCWWGGGEFTTSRHNFFVGGWSVGYGECSLVSTNPVSLLNTFIYWPQQLEARNLHSATVIDISRKKIIYLKVVNNKLKLTNSVKYFLYLSVFILN